MNELDYVLLTVVGFSGLMAIMRGLLREVVGLLGWGMAFITASRFSEMMGQYLSHWVHEPRLLNPLAFFVVFASTLIFFSILGKLLKNLVGQVGLSMVDRFLGLCFGLARGVLILMIGLILFQRFQQDTKPSLLISQSLLSPYLVSGSDWMIQRLPNDWVLTQSTVISTDIEQISISPNYP